MAQSENGNDRRPVVYLAGPYRAETLEEVRVHVEVASRVGQALTFQCGMSVICPHSMTHGWEAAVEYSDDIMLDALCELVPRCDAMLMLPGWEDSEGAKQERFEAETTGEPLAVFEAIRDLAQWAGCVRSTGPDECCPGCGLPIRDAVILRGDDAEPVQRCCLCYYSIPHAARGRRRIVVVRDVTPRDIMLGVLVRERIVPEETP